MRAVIERFDPTAVCMERVFINMNNKTSLSLGEARGALIATAVSDDIDLVEISALQMKKAITGYGRANKKIVAACVSGLLSLEESLPLDTTDALACAITYHGQHRIQQIAKKHGGAAIAFRTGRRRRRRA